MSRTCLALTGAALFFVSCDTALWSQSVGGWRNSPPGSRVIVHDGKGRRLFWDDNGQIVGWYSFHKRKYESIAADEPRKTESIEETSGRAAGRAAGPPAERAWNPRRLAIVYRGSGGGDSSALLRPKVIQGQYNRAPIVRYRPPDHLLDEVVQSPARPPSIDGAVSVEPMDTP